MSSDISELVELKSYCQDCIDRYDRIKSFDVSKRFRYISDHLEEIIQHNICLRIFLANNNYPDSITVRFIVYI